MHAAKKEAKAAAKGPPVDTGTPPPLPPGGPGGPPPLPCRAEAGARGFRICVCRMAGAPPLAAFCALFCALLQGP